MGEGPTSDLYNLRNRSSRVCKSGLYVVRGQVAEDANDTLEIQTNINFHEGNKCSVGSHARPLCLLNVTTQTYDFRL